MCTTIGTYYSLNDCLLSWLNQDNRQSCKKIISINCCKHWFYLLMMGLDAPETCRDWRNILRISCASSWVFITRVSVDIWKAVQTNCKWYIWFVGHAVAQLVEALRYKPEGHRFDSRWCHWIFSLTQSFRQHYGPGVDSASNRNEYQECFLGVKAAGA